MPGCNKTLAEIGSKSVPQFSDVKKLHLLKVDILFERIYLSHSLSHNLSHSPSESKFKESKHVNPKHFDRIFNVCEDSQEKLKYDVKFSDIT